MLTFQINIFTHEKQMKRHHLFEIVFDFRLLFNISGKKGKKNCKRIKIQLLNFHF